MGWRPPARGSVVWCLGVYGSASTWTFNAVRLIHARAEPALPCQARFAAGMRDLARLPVPGATVIKTHEIDDPAALARLHGLASRIVITTRDPRDSVSSLMSYHHHGFDRALHHVERAAALVQRFAADPRAMCNTYENRFFDDPATPARIADHLRIALPDTAAAGIFATLTRANVERRIAALPTTPGTLINRTTGDQLDPQTQWHTHHAGRTGEIGRWRRHLTAEQARTVLASVPWFGLGEEGEGALPASTPD